jgi:hypothetical protein
VRQRRTIAKPGSPAKSDRDKWCSSNFAVEVPTPQPPAYATAWFLAGLAVGMLFHETVTL